MPPKQPYSKRRLAIRVMMVLCIASLFYAAYDAYSPFKIKDEITEPKEEYPEYFDFGTITDSTYCNDFFGFRMPITKGYNGYYKKYDYLEKNLYERDSVLANPRLASTIGNHELLLIEPELVKIDWVENIKETKSLEGLQDYLSEKSKRDRFGADYQLIIRAYNLSGQSLGSYIKTFSNLHNPNYGNPITKLISGIEFREYQGITAHGDAMREAMFGIMGGKNKEITSYNAQIHGFALSIDLFYTTEEQKCILLGIVNEISFH